MAAEFTLSARSLLHFHTVIACAVPVVQFGQVVVAEVADDPGGAVGAPSGVAGQGKGV